jgi:TonB family protein
VKKHTIGTLCIVFSVLGLVHAQDEKVHQVVEVMPTVKGCEEQSDWHARHQCAQEKIAEHLKETLKYPSDAIASGIEGVAVVSFVVTDNGRLDDFTIVEDPGHGMGEAALKALKKMRKDWVVGTNRGVPVNTLMKVPVSFTLPEEEPEEPEIVMPDIFTHPDQMPRFAGCEDKEGTEAQNCTFQKITQYMRDSLQYPEQARASRIEGTVVTKFVIDETGHVTSPEVVKGIGGGCDEEALRLLSAMPTWLPGKHNGDVVKVELQLPFQFRLGSD